MKFETFLQLIKTLFTKKFRYKIWGKCPENCITLQKDTMKNAESGGQFW